MGRQIVVAVPIDDLWRFWSFIDSHKEGECWPWRKQGKNKYGNFTIKGENFLAHRFSYQIFNGSFDPNLVVRHTCDNTRCVNPDHLVLGTQKDNKQDGRDRERNAKGSTHGRSTVTENDVIQIRRILETTEMSDAAIAEQFNCSPGCIWNIRHRKSWDWL